MTPIEDALVQQAGVVRTETPAELFDVALLLDSQILPNGNRVGIITNNGAPAILCAIACEAGGLVVPPLPEAVRTELARFLPTAASTANPVEMLAAASGEDYRHVMGALAASGAIDALIVIFTPPLVTKPEDARRAVHRAARELSRTMPVLSVFMSKESTPHVDRGGCLAVPDYPFPEEAARALSLVARYSAWRRLQEEARKALSGIDDVRAAAVIAEHLSPLIVSPEARSRSRPESGSSLLRRGRR